MAAPPTGVTAAATTAAGDSDMDILYEDPYLVIAVKPVGVLSEDSPDAPCMPALLRRHYRDAGQPDFIATVHRLDKGWAA